MPLRYLALVTALLPFVAVHLSYLFSASQGHVEWCVPYIDGCTSISGTGRHGTAYFLFKGLMIPAAVFMASYWWFKSQWLVQLGDSGITQQRVLVSLGVIASIGLVFYAVALGSIGPEYRLQRRIGVMMYFGFTLLAQILALHRLSRLVVPELLKPYRFQYGLCVSMLLLGLFHLAWDIGFPHLGDIDDVVEWNFSLLLIGYYFVSYWLWRYQSVDITLAFRQSER